MFPSPSFSVVHGNVEGGGADLVMSLHSCGDLTRRAYAYAEARDLEAVLVPCCYSKRTPPAGLVEVKDFEVVKKLAECNDAKGEGLKAKREAERVLDGLEGWSGGGGGMAWV